MIILLSIFSRIKLFLQSTWFDPAWYKALFAKPKALLLSQNILPNFMDLSRSLESPLSRWSSRKAAFKCQIYSASIVDNAIVGCFLKFQEIAPPFMRKMYPVIKRLSSTSTPSPHHHRIQSNPMVSSFWKIYFAFTILLSSIEYALLPTNELYRGFDSNGL